MRWIKPNLRSSIYALLSLVNPSARQESLIEYDIDDIRNAMLALMAETGSNQFAYVTRRIRYADDVQALWYLRGDLMAVLAGTYGEAVAREKIKAITQLFDNMLPGGLKSRHSPLSEGSRDE